MADQGDACCAEPDHDRQQCVRCQSNTGQAGEGRDLEWLLRRSLKQAQQTRQQRRRDADSTETEA